MANHKTNIELDLKFSSNIDDFLTRIQARLEAVQARAQQAGQRAIDRGAPGQGGTQISTVLAEEHGRVRAELKQSGLVGPELENAIKRTAERFKELEATLRSWANENSLGRIQVKESSVGKQERLAAERIAERGTSSQRGGDAKAAERHIAGRIKAGERDEALMSESFSKAFLAAESFATKVGEARKVFENLIREQAQLNTLISDEEKSLRLATQDLVGVRRLRIAAESELHDAVTRDAKVLEAETRARLSRDSASRFQEREVIKATPEEDILDTAQTRLIRERHIRAINKKYESLLTEDDLGDTAGLKQEQQRSRDQIRLRQQQLESSEDRSLKARIEANDAAARDNIATLRAGIEGRDPNLAKRLKGLDRAKRDMDTLKANVGAEMEAERRDDPALQAARQKYAMERERTAAVDRLGLEEEQASDDLLQQQNALAEAFRRYRETLEGVMAESNYVELLKSDESLQKATMELAAVRSERAAIEAEIMDHPEARAMKVAAETARMQADSAIKREKIVSPEYLTAEAQNKQDAADLKARVNDMQRQIAAERGGRYGEGTWFQRVQASVGERMGGPVRDPSSYMKFGQFLTARALTTGGFMASGAVLYGGVQMFKDIFDESTALQQEFAIIRSQLDNIDESARSISFGEVREGIRSISVEAGVAADRTALMTRQLAGAFSEPGTGAPNLARALEETETAMKASKILGLDDAQAQGELLAISIAFVDDDGVQKTFESILDQALHLEETTGATAGNMLEFAASVAPIAQDVGFTSEQLVALGARLTLATNLPGQKIADDVSRIFPEITENQTVLYEKLGSNTRTKGMVSDLIASIGQNEMAETFRILTEAYQALDPTQDSDLRSSLRAVVDNRLSRTWTALLAGGDATIQALDAEEGQGAGMLGGRWDRYTHTVRNKLEQLRQEFRALGSELMEGGIAQGIATLIDMLQVVLSGLTSVAGLFEKMNRGTGNWLGQLLLLTAAMKALSPLGRMLGNLAIEKGIGSLILNKGAFGGMNINQDEEGGGGLLDGLIGFITGRGGKGGGAAGKLKGLLGKVKGPAIAATVILGLSRLRGMNADENREIEEEIAKLSNIYESILKDGASAEDLIERATADADRAVRNQPLWRQGIQWAGARIPGAGRLLRGITGTSDVSSIRDKYLQAATEQNEDRAVQIFAQADFGATLDPLIKRMEEFADNAPFYWEENMVDIFRRYIDNIKAAIASGDIDDLYDSLELDPGEVAVHDRVDGGGRGLLAEWSKELLDAKGIVEDRYGEASEELLEAESALERLGEDSPQQIEYETQLALMSSQIEVGEGSYQDIINLIRGRQDDVRGWAKDAKTPEMITYYNTHLAELFKEERERIAQQVGAFVEGRTSLGTIDLASSQDLYDAALWKLRQYNSNSAMSTADRFIVAVEAAQAENALIDEALSEALSPHARLKVLEEIDLDTYHTGDTELIAGQIDQIPNLIDALMMGDLGMNRDDIAWYVTEMMIAKGDLDQAVLDEILAKILEDNELLLAQLEQEMAEASMAGEEYDDTEIKELREGIDNIKRLELPGIIDPKRARREAIEKQKAKDEIERKYDDLGADLALEKALLGVNDTVGAAEIAIREAELAKDKIEETDGDNTAALKLADAQIAEAKRDWGESLKTRAANLKSALFDVQRAQADGDPFRLAQIDIQEARYRMSIADGPEETEAARAAMISAGLRERDVQRDAELAYGELQAQMVARQPVAHALRNLQNAQLALSHAKPGGETHRAQMAVVAAQQALEDARNDEGTAMGEYLAAVRGRDGVAHARQNLANATRLVGLAQGEAAQYRARIAELDAKRALDDAILEVFTAQADLAAALAESTGNMVEGSRQALLIANERLRHARSQGAGRAETDQLRAEAVRAQTAYTTAQRDDRLGDLDYLYEFDRITASRYIELLRAEMMKIPESNKTARREIERRIKALRDEMSSNIEFNIPGELRLPTLYEIRRMDQMSSYGLGQSYQDNRQITININQSDDPAGTLAIINDALGRPPTSSGPGLY